MIPVWSEGRMEISYNERWKWGQFWLVDQLDGTKEFIKKNRIKFQKRLKH